MAQATISKTFDLDATIAKIESGELSRDVAIDTAKALFSAGQITADAFASALQAIALARAGRQYPFARRTARGQIFVSVCPAKKGCCHTFRITPEDWDRYRGALAELCKLPADKLPLSANAK